VAVVPPGPHDEPSPDGRDRWGVSDGWWGTDGRWHAVEQDARDALHAALGAADHPDGPPEGPSVWFVTEGDTPVVWSPGEVIVEDGGSVAVRHALPGDLPLGHHRLVSDGDHLTHVFVVPPRVPALRRGWGWAVQLHAARSRASWGIGDLGDLATIARMAERDGASMVAHSPLGATVPAGPQQPSPYYASSRRFLSPLYLRIPEVDGAELAPDEVARAAAAGRLLDDDPRIDRDEVWRLKQAVLDAVWERVRDHPQVVASVRATDGDGALVRHARFCALAEHHGGGRSTFPAHHAHPDRPEVAAFAVEHADRVDFWRWLQLQGDSQLARAAAAGAPLMADLPVGFDPDGSDAWADQDLLATGCRIGAPPDDFAPLGQDWGLPPYIPWKLRSALYEPWTDTLRRQFRDAGALRIDHVMGLFRLYCIPPGFDATRGGYVRQVGTELLDLACLEAARAGASLVGEDLGTVEPAVREAMADRGVYGYRVGWFSDDPPEAWPARTVAMMSTHDLPTVAGLWSGTDTADRTAAGRPADPDGDALLRHRLAALSGLGDDAPARDMTLAAHRALAGAGSDLVLATLEDALGVEHRPNLPGTVDEHPNWLLALPAPVEELGAAGTDRLARILADAPGRAGARG
jgi:4-alpha-glucanotransferase